MLSQAKVNLFLKVTGRREDGCHHLNSLFQKISLADSITIRTNDSGSIGLKCSDESLPTDERNLIVKAAKMLRYQSGAIAGADIDLIKEIPVGAGLGGGSSDGATTLMTLNEMWGINLSRERLMEIAVEIGADVPFFLGGDLAWVEGTGERLSPLVPQKSFWILLVNPGFHISAGEAYTKSRFNFAKPVNKEKIIEDCLSGDPKRIAKNLHNDLEPWALNNFPVLARLKTEMETTAPKPLGVLMTGSGPTLMAFYETKERCLDARMKLKNDSRFVRVVKTCV